MPSEVLLIPVFSIYELKPLSCGAFNNLSDIWKLLRSTYAIPHYPPPNFPSSLNDFKMMPENHLMSLYKHKSVLNKCIFKKRKK